MRKKAFFIVLITFLLSIAIFWFLNNDKKPKMNTPINSNSEIKYIALGDSYTIGLGVKESERWPNILVENLKSENLNVNLIANPAVSGYRVYDALQRELPVVEKQKPDFVTVLIGANDNFGGKDPDTYKQELIQFLDKLQPLLSNPKNIVLITIPDYSKSPAGKGYSVNNISKSIEEYNQVIKVEANKRGLKVADIFPISQRMTGAEDYISDGLHPSGQGYAKWEKVIFPVVLELLDGLY